MGRHDVARLVPELLQEGSQSQDVLPAQNLCPGQEGWMSGSSHLRQNPVSVEVVTGEELPAGNPMIIVGYTVRAGYLLLRGLGLGPELRKSLHPFMLRRVILWVDLLVLLVAPVGGYDLVDDLDGVDSDL